MPNGKAKRCPRQVVAVDAPQAIGVGNEPSAQKQGTYEVDPTTHAEDERQQGGRQQHPGVEEYLQARKVRSVCDGQHRQARLAVVLGPVQSQGPEVRRCPQEDDETQHHGLGTHLTCHGRPAQHWRHGTRRAPNHNVLRRQRFEHDRVDHGVTHKSGKGQPHGQCVHPDVKQQAAAPAQKC